jgi:hypothetical protein
MLCAEWSEFIFTSPEWNTFYPKDNHRLVSLYTRRPGKLHAIYRGRTWFRDAIPNDMKNLD